MRREKKEMARLAFGNFKKREFRRRGEEGKEFRKDKEASLDAKGRGYGCRRSGE